MIEMIHMKLKSLPSLQFSYSFGYLQTVQTLENNSFCKVLQNKEMVLAMATGA